MPLTCYCWKTTLRRCLTSRWPTTCSSPAHWSASSPQILFPTSSCRMACDRNRQIRRNCLRNRRNFFQNRRNSFRSDLRHHFHFRCCASRNHSCKEDQLKLLKNFSEILNTDFFMLALLRRISFLTSSMVYILVINTHITNYNLSQMAGSK